jgi:type II secretory ATPase GspE/PulE/Tfp pilus assembly ATPase PilB-like protein
MKKGFTLIASSTIGILAQRLVSSVCPNDSGDEDLAGRWP